MKISKTILAVLATASLTLGLLSQNAQAVQINGSIGFDGTGSGTVVAGTSTLTFNPGVTVGARSGDYLATGVTFGTAAGPFAPISWTGTGITAALVGGPTLQWSFMFGGTTMTFTLQGLTSAQMLGGSVNLSGFGIATMTGAVMRDPTPATFSVQGTGSNFTFQIIQASNTANPVPEGGSAIALLGIGMMGLEVLRRKLAS